MKKLFALILILSLLAPFAAADDERYYDILDVGEGAFYANVIGDEQSFGEGSEEGVYVEPLLVYVNGEGEETAVAYGSIVEVLEGCVVICRSAEAYVDEYLLYGFDGACIAGPFRAVAGFSGGDYSIAQDESGLWGVIDRAGTYVIQPEYAAVYQNGDESAAGYASSPYFCRKPEGGIDAVSSWTLQVIGSYAEVDQYLWATYLNPAVFMLENWSSRIYCSAETGEELFRVAVPEVEHDFYAEGDYARTEIIGEYSAFAAGMPERMVRAEGIGADKVYTLIDNQGNAVSGEFQLIEPLVWSGEEGVFLYATFDPAQYAGEESFWGAYTPMELYGEAYRCGLIDQDGNILVEAAYTSIDVLSPTEFDMECYGEREMYVVGE